MTQLEIKMDAGFEGPLRFEGLLTEISIFFVNLPPA